MSKIRIQYAVALLAIAVAGQVSAQSGPEAVAVYMMGTFEGVNPDAVKTEVLSQTATAAVVGASAPQGRLCTFNVEKAPEGVTAPYGWLVGDVSCAHRSGGIPVVDMGELNKLNQQGK